MITVIESADWEAAHQHRGLITSPRPQSIHGASYSSYYERGESGAMLAVIQTDDFKMIMVDERKVQWQVEVHGDYEAFQKFITMIRLAS